MVMQDTKMGAERLLEIGAMKERLNLPQSKAKGKRLTIIQ